MPLLIPNAAETEWLKRALFGRGGSITGATNATPIVITSNGHGLANGQCVVISDVGGNTAANGTFIVGSVTANTFALYATTTGTGGAGVAGNGAYTAGGAWSLAGMEDVKLKLFSSNTTPAETDTAGTYTESAFTGYTAGGVTLVSKYSTAAAWGTPASGSPTGSWSAEAAVAEAAYPQQSWNATSVENCYGYFLVGANSGTLLGAERFASVVGLTNPSTLQITPKLGLA